MHITVGIVASRPIGGSVYKRQQNSHTDYIYIYIKKLNKSYVNWEENGANHFLSEV